MVGKKPVITEFEARQRGIEIPERTREEKEKARARSDATMRSAVKLFIAMTIGLAGVSVVVYLRSPDLLIYFTPVYAGVGVLFVFVVMWLDEEREKAKYLESRIER